MGRTEHFQLGTYHLHRHAETTHHMLMSGLHWDEARQHKKDKNSKAQTTSEKRSHESTRQAQKSDAIGRSSKVTSNQETLTQPKKRNNAPGMN